MHLSPASTAASRSSVNESIVRWSDDASSRAEDSALLTMGASTAFSPAASAAFDQSVSGGSGSPHATAADGSPRKELTSTHSSPRRSQQQQQQQHSKKNLNLHPFFTHQITGGEATFEDHKTHTSPLRGASPAKRNRSASPPQRRPSPASASLSPKGSMRDLSPSKIRASSPFANDLQSPAIAGSPQTAGVAGGAEDLLHSLSNDGGQQQSQPHQNSTSFRRGGGGGPVALDASSAASSPGGGRHHHTVRSGTTVMGGTTNAAASGGLFAAHWGMTSASPGQDTTATLDRAIRPDGTFVMEAKHHVKYPHSTNPTQKLLKIPLRNCGVPELNDLDYHYLEPDADDAIPGTFEEKNVFEDLLKANSLQKLCRGIGAGAGASGGSGLKKEPAFAPSVELIRRARKSITQQMASPSDDGSTEPAVSRFAETPSTPPPASAPPGMQHHAGGAPSAGQPAHAAAAAAHHQPLQPTTTTTSGKSGMVITGTDQEQHQQAPTTTSGRGPNKFPVTREQVLHEVSSPSMDEETVKSRLRRLYVSNRGFTPDVGGKQLSADGVVTTSGDVAEEVAMRLLHVFGPAPNRPRGSPSKHDNVLNDERDGDIDEERHGWPRPTVLGVQDTSSGAQRHGRGARARGGGADKSAAAPGNDPHQYLEHASQIPSSARVAAATTHQHQQHQHAGKPGSINLMTSGGARSGSSSARPAVTARMHRPSTATAAGGGGGSTHKNTFSAPTSAAQHAQREHIAYRPMRMRPTSDKELQNPPKIIYPSGVKPRQIGEDVRFHKGAPPSYVVEDQYGPSSSSVAAAAEEDASGGRGGGAAAVDQHHHRRSTRTSSPPGSGRPRSPVFVDSRLTPRVGTAAWVDSTQKLNDAVEKATESQIRVARAFRRRQVLRDAHGQKEDDALAGLVFRTLKRETVEQESAPELPEQRQVEEETVPRYKTLKRMKESPHLFKKT